MARRRGLTLSLLALSLSALALSTIPTSTSQYLATQHSASQLSASQPSSRSATFTQKLEEDQPPDLPEESDRPEPHPHEEPQDHGPADAEMGFPPVQREFAEYPGNTQVICDGPQCGYRRATLPGSRGFKDSYFPISEIRKDKELIARMISKLGQPCGTEACKAAKLKRVEGLIDEVNKIRRGNKAAVEKAEQEGGAEGLRRQSGSGTLEAPASSFLDVNELHCSVSIRTRETCSMCGGPKAFRFKGYHVELMSPREQRFIPFYPFGSRSEQETARRMLKMIAPDSINTMSLANNGELTCLSSSPPPMVYNTLEELGVDVHSLVMNRGMYSVEQLKWTPVLSVRINNVGRTDIKLPETGTGSVTTRPDNAEVQSVTVMWAESRTAWEKETELVPFLVLHDTVGALQIRYHAELLDKSAANELHQYINGSMMFDRYDIPVVASQPKGSAYGVVKGSSPGPLSVANVLFGLGCTDKRLKGTSSANCDPLPEVAISNNLRALNYDKATLSALTVDTSFSTNGGIRFGSKGEVRYKITGVPSVMDNCDSTILAGFSQVGDTEKATMHFVWILSPQRSSGYTATKLIHLVTGWYPSPMLATLQLGDPSLIMSKNKVSVAQGSFLLPLLSAVDEGVALRAVLTHSSESDIDQFLTRLLGTNSRVQLQGPISMKETSMIGSSGDLDFTKGVKMVQPVLRLTVRMDGGDGSSPCSPASDCDNPPAFEMGFQGEVLLPVSSFESLRMDGYLGVATKGAADGKLVASLPNTVHSIFGVPTMHLSYLVLSQPIFGAEVSQFITEGVVSLGATCSADNMKIPGDCIEGQVLMSFDTSNPNQNMMSGLLPPTDIGFLLRFVGLRSSSWYSNRHNFATTSIPGATMAYSLVDHFFTLSEEEGAEPKMFSVPRGFSGQGLMKILNTNVSMHWRSNLHDGNFDLLGVLPRIVVGDMVLEREKNSKQGPLLKMNGSVNSQNVNTWIQGFLTLGTFQNFMLFRVSDEAVEGRGIGRFGAGVHSHLQVSAPLRNRDFNKLQWTVHGHLTPMGIKEMMRKLPDAILATCKADTMYCTGRRESEVLRKDWYHVCSASFSWQMTHDEDSPKEPMTIVKALVYGRDRTLSFKMPLSNHKAAVDALAQSLYQDLMGSAYYYDIIPSYACQQPSLPALFELPALAQTFPDLDLPGAKELRQAIEKDNADLALQTLNPEKWTTTAKAMGVERERVMLKAWEVEKEAWDYDESLRTAANPEHKPARFSTPKPHPGQAQLGLPRTHGFGGGGDNGRGQVLPMTWRQHIRGDHFLVRQRLSGVKDRLERVKKAAQATALSRFEKQLEASKEALEAKMERSEYFADKLARAQQRLSRAKSNVARGFHHKSRRKPEHSIKGQGAEQPQPSAKGLSGRGAEQPQPSAQGLSGRGAERKERSTQGLSGRGAEQQLADAPESRGELRGVRGRGEGRSSVSQVERLRGQLLRAQEEEEALHSLDRFARRVQEAGQTEH